MTYDVTITERLVRNVSVEASNSEEAEALVQSMYNNGDIILIAEDFDGSEISAEREGVCPVCGADLEYEGNNKIDDDGGVLPWTCRKCGAHGEEGYTRQFNGHWNVCEGDEDHEEI